MFLFISYESGCSDLEKWSLAATRHSTSDRSSLHQASNFLPSSLPLFPLTSSVNLKSSGSGLKLLSPRQQCFQERLILLFLGNLQQLLGNNVCAPISGKRPDSFLFKGFHNFCWCILVALEITENSFTPPELNAHILHQSCFCNTSSNFLSVPGSIHDIHLMLLQRMHMSKCSTILQEDIFIHILV